MSSAQPKITFEQAKAAIVFPFENIGAVIKLGLFPVIFALIIIFTAFAAMVPSAINVQSPQDLEQLQLSLIPAQIIMQLTIIIFGSIFAVGVHRFIILRTPPAWTFFRFRKYELYYILANIVIVVVLILTYFASYLVLYYLLSVDLAYNPDTPPSPALLIVLFLLFGLYMWIYSKLILALPNAAITGHLSLATSWHALKGNFWRFVGFGIVIILAYMLLYLILIILVMVLLAIIPSQIFAILLNLALMFLFPLAGTAFVAYLSFVYKQLVAQPAHQNWMQNGGTGQV
jgi:hypothetical protein